MQTAIERLGPLRVATGSLTVLCLAVVEAQAHAGVALQSRDAWAARGRLYPNLGAANHSCGSRPPQTCVMITQLRAMQRFVQKCMDQTVRATFLFDNPEVVALIQSWRTARSRENAKMPLWYNGTELNRFPRLVRDRSKTINARLITEENTDADRVRITREIGSAVNQTLWQDSRVTTPHLNALLDPLFAALVD